MQIDFLDNGMTIVSMGNSEVYFEKIEFKAENFNDFPVTLTEFTFNIYSDGELLTSGKVIADNYIDSGNEKIISVYLPFMIILACLESPLNALAFELFFKDTLLFSYGIALALGTILIYFAHVGGEKIKETTCKELEQSKTSRYILVIVLSLFAFIVIWFLAQMRHCLLYTSDDADE